MVAENVYQTTRSGANSGRPARERLINNFTWSTVPENLILCSEITTFSSGEEQEEMKDGRIDLRDGSNLSGIDFVILATGYLYSFPFLSDLATRASENIHPPLKRSSLRARNSTTCNLIHSISTIPRWLS
jgi:hypothetical protein